MSEYIHTYGSLASFVAHAAFTASADQSISGTVISDPVVFSDDCQIGSEIENINSQYLDYAQTSVNRLWHFDELRSEIVDEEGYLPQAMIVHFYDGERLAFEGKYSEALVLWESDLENFSSPEQQQFVYENITWLALFFNQDTSLYGYASVLCLFDPDSVLGLYALALDAYNTGDYEMAVTYLKRINLSSQCVSDQLYVLLERLCRLLAHKISDPCLDQIQRVFMDRSFLFEGDAVRHQLMAFSQYSLYVEASQEAAIRELFGQDAILAVDAFVLKLRELLSDSKYQFTIMDIPWLVHSYVTYAFSYKASQDSVLALDEIFQQKQYDCTEYTRLMCYVLTQFGYEADIVYYQSGQGNVWHSLCVYGFKGQWAYASSQDLAKKVYSSRKEVLQDIYGDVYQGELFFKRWSQEQRNFVKITE